MKLYKLLSKNQYPGYMYRTGRYEVNKKFLAHEQNGNPKVCTPKAVHSYIHPAQAALFSGNHVTSRQNILWEATTQTPIDKWDNAGDKIGTKDLTIRKKIVKFSKKKINNKRINELLSKIAFELAPKTKKQDILDGKAASFSLKGEWFTTSTPNDIYSVRKMSKHLNPKKLQEIYREVFDEK